MLLIFLLIIILILINYFRVKSVNVINVINVKTNKYPHSKIKILSFNCQRMPYFFREKLNMTKIIDKYDVICLQENFCSLFGNNKLDDENDCIFPGGSMNKIVDSGLSIYSKYKMEFIDFIRFDNLDNIDFISDKGFLVIKIKDIYIINTHLQASYYSIENPIAREQIDIIIEYINENNINKVIICGDFNINLNTILIPNYQIIVPYKPTHWQLINDNILNSIISETSSTYKEGLSPCYFDGGIYKNIEISNVIIEKIDKYSDHLGISFEIL